MTHYKDMTFCVSKECPQAQTCHRSVTRHDLTGKMVSQADFLPEADANGVCQYRIEVTDTCPQGAGHGQS